MANTVPAISLAVFRVLGSKTDQNSCLEGSNVIIDFWHPRKPEQLMKKPKTSQNLLHSCWQPPRLSHGNLTATRHQRAKVGHFCDPSVAVWSKNAKFPGLGSIPNFGPFRPSKSHISSRTEPIDMGQKPTPRSWRDLHMPSCWCEIAQMKPPKRAKYCSTQQTCSIGPENVTHCCAEQPSPGLGTLRFWLGGFNYYAA